MQAAVNKTGSKQPGSTAATDFAEPNWAAPEDTSERLAQMPADATARGMFFEAVAETLKRTGSREKLPRNYIRFKDYPMRDFIELAPRAGQVAYGCTPREGLRRLGQDVYTMFANTLVGAAIFTIAARTFPETLRVSPRAYEVSIHPGSVHIAELIEGRAVLELRDVWSFPDTYHVGIFEGAMRMFRLNGRVQVRSYSPADCDFLITW